MNRYADHSRRFEEVASRRRSDNGVAEVIPFQGPPGAPWLQGACCSPHLVEIPLMRDVHCLVENRQCVGSYQILMFPTTAALATIDARCLRTGNSSGRELTASTTLYPFWVRF